MSAIDLSEVDRQRRQANKLYLEFLRAPGLSLGLYVLPPGGSDTQQPHDEDEVYDVIRGNGRFRLGEDERGPTRQHPVRAGRRAAPLSLGHRRDAHLGILRAGRGHGAGDPPAVSGRPLERRRENEVSPAGFEPTLPA